MKVVKVLAIREWLISHLFIWVGLILISVWLYGVNPAQVNLLVLGIWLLVGGFCWMAAYALRKLASK